MFKYLVSGWRLFVRYIVMLKNKYCAFRGFAHFLKQYMKLLVAVRGDERRAEMVTPRNLHGISTKHCPRDRELKAKLEC